jgi:hypothetical protein
MSIPLDQKFHTIAANVATKERGSALVNSQKEIFTMQDVANTVRPYKVYTALLTQSGGNTPVLTIGDETISKGVTYTIISLEPGDNLIPYGAPNNNVGTSFVCNQEISNWGNPASELSWNEGAPVATVLENTIGNVWWTYDDIGIYIAQSSGLFTLDKSFSLMTLWTGSLVSINSFRSDDNAFGININELDSPNNAIDLNGVLQIEIRVYE